MTIMRKATLISTLIVFIILHTACCGQEQTVSQRAALLSSIQESVSSGHTMYGHQDDLMYGHTWRLADDDDKYENSDTKATCGRYPAVLGLDLGEVELGGEANLDGNLFTQMRGAAIAHHIRGGVVTLSWHPRNPFTGGDAWDYGSGEAVKSIIAGGENHNKFINGWLRPVADFIESLVTPQGEAVPVIFRPWHEHTGSWFWWGEDICTIDEYKALWRMTYDYMQERSLNDRIVWAYSPSTQGEQTVEHFMERYPGDDIIDILGVDAYYTQTAYETEVRACLDCLKQICDERGKLMALTETGWESIPSDKWWCGILLPILKEYPVVYALTWRNAWNRPEHFYGPWPEAQCAEDFTEFAADGHISMIN